MLNGYKTYIGLAIAAVIVLAQTLGITVPASDELPGWLDNILALLAILFAAYGRNHKERRAPE